MASFVGKALLAIAVTGLALSCACQRHSQDSTDETPPTVAVPFAFKAIHIGKDANNGPPARVDPVTTEDPIVVTIDTVGQPKAADLSARLFFLGTGQEVGNATLRLSEATPTPIVLLFSAAPDRMPGRYLLEIKLGGKLAEKRDVDIFPKSLEPAKR